MLDSAQGTEIMWLNFSNKKNLWFIDASKRGNQNSSSYYTWKNRDSLPEDIHIDVLEKRHNKANGDMTKEKRKFTIE